MKNLKKVVALVLAFAMVLSMGTVAFAAENATEADALYNLGLLKGYSTTEKVLGLDDAADAQQAIKLIGVALGWEVDAEATVDFTDVADWAVPYVAKAVELGVTNGVSATEFGTEVDGKRMVTWLLRALGYESAAAWENTDTLAAEAGITVPTASLRDDVVGVIYESLMAKKVGSDTTLLDDLIAAGTVTEADAIAEGLKEAAPEEFALVSAEGFGLAAIKFTFTSDVDSLTVTDEDADAAVANEVVDGSTVIVTFDAAEDQNDEVEVEFDAEGKDGVKIDGEKVKVTLSDRVDPTLVSVTVDNAKTFVVKYSEPINMDPADLGTQVFDNVKIDGSKFVGTATQSDDLTEITYKSNNAYDANSYTFTTQDVEDYAGFVASSEDVTVTVVTDDAAPVLTEVKVVDRTNLELIFDEDLASIGDVEVGSYTVASATVDGDDKNIVNVVLGGGDELKASDAFVAVTVKYSDAKDLLDNESDDDIEFTFTAPLDDEAPTVTVTVTSDNYLMLEFSEDVTGHDALAAYDLTDDDDDDANVLDSIDTDIETSDDYDADDDDDNKILIVASDITINEGNYTLTVGKADIVDTSVLKNVVAEKEFKVVMNDTEAPTYGAASYIIDTDFDEQAARITFSEEMDIATLSDEGNYLFEDAPLTEIDDYEIKVASDGKSVDIVIPSADGDPVILDNTDEFKVFGLKDVAGNSIAAPGGVIGIDDAASFALATATATAPDTIEVVTTGSKDFEIADPNEFLIYDGVAKSTTHYVTSAVLDADDAFKVILTLNDDLDADATLVGAVSVRTIGAEDTVDLFGTAVDDANLPLVDDIAPSIDDVVYDSEDGTMVIKFTEAVADVGEDNDEAEVLADILLRDGDGDLVTLDVDQVTADSDDNYSSFTEITIDSLPADDYSIEILSRNIVDDTAANVLVAYEEVDMAVEDTTAPTIASAAVTVANTQITVTFDEVVSGTFGANDGGFVVTATGEATTYAVSNWAQGADGKLIVLTVADFSAEMGVGNGGVTVTYATGGNGDVADVNSVALATDATGAVIPE